MRNMVNYQKIQCDNCGSVDFIEYADETLVCKHCRTGYRRIEAEQSLYERKEWCRDAEHWRKLENFGMAEEVYRKLSQKYPRNYAGWYGLTKLIDWDTWYYRQDPDDSNPPLPDYCAIALKTAHDQELYNEINAYYCEMRSKYQKPAQEARRNYENTIKDYDEAIENNEKAIISCNQKIDKLSSSKESTSGSYREKFFGDTFFALQYLIWMLFSVDSCNANLESFSFKQYFRNCAILFIGFSLIWIVIKGIFVFRSDTNYSIKLGTNKSIDRKIEKIQENILLWQNANQSNRDYKSQIVSEHSQRMTRSIIKRTNKLNINL